MSKDIEVALSLKGDVSILAIAGDVTPVTGEVIEASYRKATAAGAKKILLLFNGENYINSGGIAILIGITAESRAAGQVIRITGLSDHFRKIFAMVGLTKYAQVFLSEEEALRGF
jgi:anti-anti-sigma factor